MVRLILVEVFTSIIVMCKVLMVVVMFSLNARTLILLSLSLAMRFTTAHPDFVESNEWGT